jgi:hypothetical protein
MAEVLISPGVLATENDQSQITSQPVQAGAAIVGPTVKGRVGVPTLVTTYSEYVANFGNIFSSGSNGDQFTFLTSISAYNYFSNGGTTLLVTRVASGSFTTATSSINGAVGTSAFELETLSQGAILNSAGAEVGYGALISGSADNYRWEIASPNTSSGTFSLLIRKGNDTNRNKSVLEIFPNVSLDPKASNYIARIIGDQAFTPMEDADGAMLQITGSYPNSSRYVRVKSVSLPTPDYLDNAGNAKAQYTSSIPLASSGAFGGAVGNVFTQNNTLYNNISTRTQGLVADNYDFAFKLLANKNEYQYNIITAPGLIYDNHSSKLNTLIENIEERGDAIIVMDLVGYGSTVNVISTTARSLDTSYAASYWPWCQIVEPDLGTLVWVPASTLIPGVYAFTDQVAEAWFAPAGINRGGLNIVRQVEKKLSQTNKDTLYQNKVNPLATFPGRGVVVYGQKTLQVGASALDRVNVRRLLIELKSFISQVAENLVFEQNTTATRNQFLATTNPYLESVQQRQGLYAFKVVMDESNNSPDIIDRNQLRGAIYLQPTKTAEFIYLDFNILPTGVQFPS